mgnify:CR=1 FL=1
MGHQLETADQIAALAFLYDRIDYERRSPPVERGEFRLDRMRQLNERLGNPAATLPCIHVAGTKGKGSTACMIQQVALLAQAMAVLRLSGSGKETVDRETRFKAAEARRALPPRTESAATPPVQKQVKQHAASEDEWEAF